MITDVIVKVPFLMRFYGDEKSQQIWGKIFGDYKDCSQYNCALSLINEKHKYAKGGFLWHLVNCLKKEKLAG